MKGAREFKRYIQRYREHLKAVHWDDLKIIIKMQTCKKWYKRNQKPTKGEYNGLD
jgi:hypothetical protein